MSVRSSVLPYEAFQGLVEVLLGLLKPFGPSDSVLLGLLRLRKALIGSLKPFDTLRGPLTVTSDSLRKASKAPRDL